MRINCTVKGDLEAYIEELHQKTGQSYSNCLYWLADAGMQYKKSVASLEFITKKAESVDEE